MRRIAGLAYLKAALTLSDPCSSPVPDDGKRAARDYLARLKERTIDRDKRISPGH